MSIFTFYSLFSKVFFSDGEQGEILDENSFVVNCIQNFSNIYLLKVLFIVIVLIIFLPLVEILVYMLLFFMFDSDIVRELNWKPKLSRYQHFIYFKVTTPNLECLKFRMPFGYLLCMYLVTFIVFIMFLILYKKFVLKNQLGNNINYSNDYALAMIVSAILFITFLIIFSYAFE